MSAEKQTTLRLLMPQWQGGNLHEYYIGAQVLAAVAPATDGPIELVQVPEPQPGEVLEIENGIRARGAVLRQTRAARQAIDRHSPDRVVTLGGDCLIDLAPMAYLNARYAGNLGVLWIDAHPDVLTPQDWPHAHTYVVSALLGRGDPKLAGEVDVPIRPTHVMYAGLDTWSAVEGKTIEGLGLRHASAAALADGSTPVLDWIAGEGIQHVAVHFDVDVLDPRTFGPVLFNNPDPAADPLVGVPRGRLSPDHVVRLLGDVSKVCDIVGLAIAEYMPWEAIATRNLLKRLPLFGG